MKIKYILIFLIILIIAILFIPMPHGGNLAEGVLHEVKHYFSIDAKKAREKEEKEWEQQKKKASESWEKFEQENPQFFQK